MIEKEKKERLLYIPIVILLTNLVVRLIDQAKMLRYFPVDGYSFDGGSYLAQLHFLKVCGFHAFCPYWYNGFTSFSFSPPGWYFFTLPLYFLFEDVKWAGFFSMIISILAGFGIIWFLGKDTFREKQKRVLLFLFFFGNAITVGSFIRLGRFHELFAWINFLAMFFIATKYREKHLDKRFVLLIPFYVFTILAYQSIGVLASFLLLSLFLVKRGKERIFVILTAITSIVLTSFWAYPFVRDIHQSVIATLKLSNLLISPGRGDFLTFLATFIIPIILLGTFYLYWNKSKAQGGLLFFVPYILLGMLMLMRIIPFIPVLNDIRPDPFLILFTFLGTYFFFQLRFETFRKGIRSILMAILIISSIVSVSANVVHTKWFYVPDDEINKALLEIMPLVKERYLFAGNFPEYVLPKLYYAYAAIYLNMSTASGTYFHLKDADYIDKIAKVTPTLERKDCGALKNVLNDVNTPILISIDDGCNALKKCDFIRIQEKDRVCAYARDHERKF